ncbi:MAG TPA: FecR family protein [Puia sp.]|nr:FecR family protein [Puia sp.]
MDLTARIPDLIFKELRAEINDSESRELKEWVSQSNEHRIFYEKFISEEKLHAEMIEFYEFKKNVFEKICREIPALRPPVVPLFSKRIWSYAAAVIFLVLIGGGGYWWMHRSSEAPVAGGQDLPKHLKNDVSPGGNKAVLTLADGSRIVLDSAHNGVLSQQGNSKVQKLDSGQLAYNTLHEKPAGIVYNMLATPRGGQYQLVLPDGSKVWLNATSSLRFPTSFTGKDREVELTGEAYFEIKGNKAMPFKVKVSRDMEVEVLGTHFNIMAYEDESAIKTTLLEGAVRVTKGGTSKMVKPGQQVQLNGKGELDVVGDVDVEEVVAWKNGYFQFHIADIETVMRQLTRWYDVDVSYEGKKPEGHFLGEISRNNNLSDVLKMLELNGVHFRVEGKKLIVL